MGQLILDYCLKKDCSQQCVGYCYFDFTGELDKRRATTSYIFELGEGPISLRSILQSKIALSTTEAKKIAATKATKETIWFKNLLGDLRVIYENIEVFCNNQSVILRRTKCIMVEQNIWIGNIIM